MTLIPLPRPITSQADGLRFFAQPEKELMRGGLEEDPRMFNNLIHEGEIHVPLKIMNIANDKGIQGKLTDCLDMPIRLATEEEYAIPSNWEPIYPALKSIIDIEHSNNINWREYYTYLSVHYTPFLKIAEQQRHAGCHTDGFQGIRETTRTKSSRSYVAVTNGGTRYFPQTFVSNLDAGEFNVFEGFDLQVQKDNHGNLIYEVAEENNFYFFDAYTVHESGAAARNGSRLFIRLTWEKKLFDRAGNTKNAMLNYDWPPVSYDVRNDLKTPTMNDIDEARLLK